MLNINKQFNDFNISANLGYSYSNYWSLARGYKGTLLGVTNLFAASNIDPSNGRISEDGGTAAYVTTLSLPTSNWVGEVCFILR